MSYRNNKKNIKKLIIGLIFIIIVTIVGYLNSDIEGYINNVITNSSKETIEVSEQTSSFNINDIPEYNGVPYVTINNNIPNFTENDYTTESFEKYSELDSLGRCGITYANICRNTMPSEGEERGEINSVQPTGWKQKKYNGKYLYNRCHLIGYQLSNENSNKLNLITGTRYMNVEGMLPFENQVAEYIRKQNKKEDKHVLYRVTPIFKNKNLLASGVQMEAYSVEDNGKGICFNVYVYNVQPGIIINYETGESSQEK